MKKHYFCKIDVWLITIIFILLSIIYNAFFSLMIFYFLAFIHELGHYFFARLFKVNCYKINFHPLGFSLIMDNILFLKPYKQILILLGGPLTFFISLVIIKLLYNYHLLSYYQYNIALENNLSLLIFNLIPFYPLDGGKILEVILLKFISSKKVKIIMIVISSIISFLLLVMCLKQNQLLLFVFILYSIVASLIFFKKDYRNYLYSRIGNISFYNKKISKNNKIYHFKHNYLLIDNSIIDEEDYIFKIRIKDLNNK